MPWIIVAALVAWVLLGDQKTPTAPGAPSSCPVDGRYSGCGEVVPPGWVQSSNYPPEPAPHQQYPTAPVGQGPALQGPSIAAGLHGQQIFAAGRDGSWIATHAPMVESSDNYRRGPVG
jgi:hypothetical protein